jgi:hypothetical protein
MVVDTNKDPQARFWVEAEVAIAKSAVFLATAEKEVEQGDFIPASVSAYYSLFHLTQALMWLLPESIPCPLQSRLIGIRDQGSELPDPNTRHEDLKNFLCAIQVQLPEPQLYTFFQSAKVLREFSSYGPRVTYDGDQPSIGPCSFKREDIQAVIKEIPSIFLHTLKGIKSQIAYDSDLAPIVFKGVFDLLGSTEFPFKNWSSPSVIHRAEQIVRDLIG